VYRFGKATPVERLVLPVGGAQVWLKREDLSPVKAYKWRGAANRMAMLRPVAGPEAGKSGLIPPNHFFFRNSGAADKI